MSLNRQHAGPSGSIDSAVDGGIVGVVGGTGLVSTALVERVYRQKCVRKSK